jgi:hypothetical protein
LRHDLVDGVGDDYAAPGPRGADDVKSTSLIKYLIQESLIALFANTFHLRSWIISIIHDGPVGSATDDSMG